MKVEIDDGGYMPIRAYPTDAGLDLYSREDITIKGYGGSAIFNTGVHIELPPNTYGKIEAIRNKRMEQEGRNMIELIDREAVRELIKSYRHSTDVAFHMEYHLDEIPTIEAVPVKFIDEVIEYLTKCRDYAIHEETKTTWDEQRQTLIMLLHEWAAWNECGRTGKYGERRANDEAY